MNEEPQSSASQGNQSKANPSEAQAPPPSQGAHANPRKPCVAVDSQLVSKLEKLFELKTCGVLSEVEFLEQKRKLLEGA